MNYPVHPLLKNHVNGISVITGDAGGQSITYFADGSPGIIYFQSEKQLHLESTNQILNPFFLYGQTVKPITLTAATKFRMIVFMLNPTALHTLFKIDAYELTDTCLDCTLLSGVGQGITAQLEEMNTLQQVDSINAWIGNLILENKTVLTNPVHYATSQLLKTNGAIPLQEIQKELQVCQRTFQRKFEQQVGVSPRLFARICRFQHSLALVKANGFEKLSDIAYETGYADQSHFIRTFKEFTGLTPLDFQKVNLRS